MTTFEDKLTVKAGFPVKSDDNSEEYHTPADELATIQRWLESGLDNLPDFADVEYWRETFLYLVYGEGEHPSVASVNAFREQFGPGLKNREFYEKLLTPNEL